MSRLSDRKQFMQIQNGISRLEIRTIVDSYDKWYQHVRFGFMLATHSASTDLPRRTDAECRFWVRKLLRRKTKEEVLARSLPNLRGKEVLDIGCNAGLKSIEASCKGAEFVLGVDRNPIAIQQARDLAAILQRLGKPVGKIVFKEIDDINARLDVLEDMDVLIACCVLYHLGPLDGLREKIAQSKITTLILQGNTLRLRRITPQMQAEGWGNLLCDIRGMTAFCESVGFQVVGIGFPNHQYPVVLASRTRP